MYLLLIISATVLLIACFYYILSLRTKLKKSETDNYELRILTSKALAENAASLSEKEKHIQYINDEKEKLSEGLRNETERAYALKQQLEVSKAYYQAQNEKLGEQRIEIETLKDRFNKDFELIAGKILDDKSSKFTEINKTNLDRILSPLREKIKAFEEKVEKVYKAESDERNILKGELGKLIELNKQISQEAHNLTKALKADTKKQGNWGEFVLDRVLELSGLVIGESYIKQSSYVNEEGKRFQPDVIINLPDNKHIIIDSKVSLIAYERLMNCHEEERLSNLNAHILSFKNHIKNLSSKNYSDLYKINSPDFVLLFVPIESSFAVAVQHDVELFEFAWNKRVVIVTPSTLLATLKTIASIWKQEQQTRNAIDIATKAGALYDKFVGFIHDLNKVGDNLEKARDSYSEAFNKLSTGNGNLITRVENLKKLGARASKQIESKYSLED